MTILVTYLKSEIIVSSVYLHLSDLTVKVSFKLLVELLILDYLVWCPFRYDVLSNCDLGLLCLFFFGWSSSLVLIITRQITVCAVPVFN